VVSSASGLMTGASAAHPSTVQAVWRGDPLSAPSWPEDQSARWAPAERDLARAKSATACPCLDV